ncbi:MgtC/SapB family protein [Nakamurella antarctica]|uniref:MgtC/SapB family protein n=1 Tax=Nakamurella antarctica TaxID=1902245 RepID=UPI0024114545|nr:MgtC/SapB family protein [Nakamurella antarctica]
MTFVLSCVIGLERQFYQKSAGMRTHVLVALGSCTFTLVSAFGFAGVLGQDVNLDPSRIAAQIVSGIGFLGAGVIFMRRNVVRGLTTAATIWVSAAVGMACGAGMPTLAAALTLLHMVALLVISPLIRRLPTQDRKRVVLITYRDGQGVLRLILAEATEMGFEASVLATKVLSRTDSEPAVAVRMRFRGGAPMSDLLLTLSEIPGVQQARLSNTSEDDSDDDDDYL